MAPEVEPVDHVVEVALGLRLFGEVLLPLPLVEQLLREQVGVGVALRVEPGPGVAVPVPRAAHAAAGLDQLHREARLTGAVELVDAGDAGADDQHVDVGTGRCELVECGFGGSISLLDTPDCSRVQPAMCTPPTALRIGSGHRRGRPAAIGARFLAICTDRLVYYRGTALREERGAAWRSWIRSGRPSRCPTRWSSLTGSPSSATSTRTSTRWRSSCCGPGSGRWRAGSRRSRRPHDFVEYEFLDQSVIVVRTDDLGVRAFQNACRHRGVRVVEGRGTCESGFTCPFHGWCYGLDGKNTFVPKARTFAEHNLQPEDIDLTPVRCEVWGGCAWINLDDDAPPLRPCIEPFATILDAWKVESLRTEWWYACRLPVNWKLAQEAFLEKYHVVETHPQLVIPGRYGLRDGEAFDPRAFIDAEIHYLRTMSDGMAGMVHANDVRIAEGLRGIELPADPTLAIATWHRTLNDAVVSWHRAAGSDIPDLNELDAQGINEPMGYCFPHYFVLPMYSSASVLPLPPAGTGGDADGDLVAHPVPRGQRAGEAHAARAVGVRRPTVAADPRSGLLEPAEAAAGPARQGLRVHAPLRADRGAHLELRADPRRLPRRPSLRAAAPGAAVGQREPARQADPRPRLLTGRPKGRRSDLHRGQESGAPRVRR